MAKREQNKVTRYQIQRWALAAGMLVSIAVARAIIFRQPPEADAYFQNVLTAAATIPSSFGPWVSLDAPVPPAAITMLRPNITVSRRYSNLQTGQHATLLLVQCSDARDLLGHYPPVCYAANGFKLIHSFSKDWTVDGLAIEGTVYTFSSTRPEELSSMIIYDFMILPDGRTSRDMDGVYETARDPRKRQFGAAQLQILVDPSASEAQRDELFTTLVQANRPTIDAILAGDTK